jgi:hypothetical protein
MRFVPAVKQATRISLSTALPVPPREHSLPVYYLVQNHSLADHEHMMATKNLQGLEISIETSKQQVTSKYKRQPKFKS